MSRGIRREDNKAHSREPRTSAVSRAGHRAGARRGDLVALACEGDKSVDTWRDSLVGGQSLQNPGVSDQALHIVNVAFDEPYV